MPPNGRKRKTNDLNLPSRVYFKHGQFWYVHRDRRWEPLGADVKEAIRKGKLYNDPDNVYGTMAYYLDAFIVHCEKRIGAKSNALAPRTYEDYKRNIEPLKIYFGKMTPAAVKPNHVGSYLDLGVELDRPIRANREKACLSACFTWMIRTGDAGITTNPCIGVRRNPETKRDRYVTNAEFHAVRQVAPLSVRSMMDLIYRTLQRPEDIIGWSRANIQTKIENGTARKVLRNDQGKTGKIVDIAITPEIDSILHALFGAAGPVVGMTLIHRKNGRQYTYSGLCTMLKRAIKKAGVPMFGFYDLKGKGATDMWQSGQPIELIQLLCGHESSKTTEVYIKQRWVATATPNQVAFVSN